MQNIICNEFILKMFELKFQDNPNQIIEKINTTETILNPV